MALSTFTSVASTSAPPTGSTWPRCTCDYDNANRTRAIRPLTGCYTFSLGWRNIRSVETNLQSHFCGVAALTSVSSGAAITSRSPVVTMCSAIVRGSAPGSIATLTASTASSAIGLYPKGTIRRYKRLDIHI
jgi:hypothetical protein